MRLQVFLRNKGVGSLRKCDTLIQQQKVQINGKTLKDPTYYLKNNDKITIDNIEYIYQVLKKVKNIYLKFNKPLNVLCSHSDKYNRKLIFDYIKDITTAPLFFAGRLDYNSRGLMLITTDGDFCHYITHPSSLIEKEYIVTLKKPLIYEYLKNISNGVIIEGVKYEAFNYKRITQKKVKMYLREGKKREIRNIFNYLNNQVIDLVRTRIGNIALDDLPEGKYMKINDTVIRELWVER